MIGLLSKIPGLLASALAIACAATVAAQATGLVWGWSKGALNPEKVVRYAGVLYGLDPLDMEPPKSRSKEPVEPRTREEIIADRVRHTPVLVERSHTVEQTTDDLRSVTLMLRRSREKYVTARDGFEALLNQLETETEGRSLRELQITLEIIAPKQSKDILREMLNAPSSDPADNVLGDVVTVLKTLPDDKLRKVLAEFKTDEERQLLHAILIEIGELDRPPTLGQAPTQSAPAKNSSSSSSNPTTGSPEKASPNTSNPAEPTS